ncbi:MAG: hypothetical protein JWN90_292 [Parcubacteria group bacterium]|nr:hypothetical protein [Parcubacteria group bacterium]
MNKKILIPLLILVVLAAGIYYMHSLSQDSTENKTSTSTTAVSIPVIPVAGWSQCQYPGFNFTVQYPKDWEVSVVSGAQGGGAHATVIKCGEIDSRSLLDEVTFSPISKSSITGGMTVKINSSKDKNSDKDIARHSIQTTGIAVYNGKQYSVTFAASTSQKTKDQVLHSFDFLP